LSGVKLSRFLNKNGMGLKKLLNQNQCIWLNSRQAKIKLLTMEPVWIL